MRQGRRERGERGLAARTLHDAREVRNESWRGDPSMKCFLLHPLCELSFAAPHASLLTHVLRLQVGIASFGADLPESSTQEEVLKVVRDFNNNPDVHGILVQLPVGCGGDQGFRV